MVYKLYRLRSPYIFNVVNFTNVINNSDECGWRLVVLIPNIVSDKSITARSIVSRYTYINTGGFSSWGCTCNEENCNFLFP